VEKWQEEEEHGGHVPPLLPRRLPAAQRELHVPSSVALARTRGTDGFSTMAEPYSMIETRPASAHELIEDVRVPHSFAGYNHSHTSQAETEVPTSMREAPAEPRFDTA